MLVVLLFALTFVPAAAARERLVPLTHSRLGTAPSVVIRDRVLPFRRLRPRALPPDAYGGDYNTADGTAVTVFMSSAYVADSAVLQSTADLFYSFYHGDELSYVTIYLAPIDEVHADCQAVDANSCFDPSSETIYLVGSPPPDGTPVEEIAAHEFGHEIAFRRLNGWSGPASNWGPEYWAAYENVCARRRAGTAFPGNEGAHYSQNPGEAWADTNRLLNGGSPSLWQFDQSFYPNSTDFRLAKQDILQPWTGNSRSSTGGRFQRGRLRSQPFTLRLPDDGSNANIKLFSRSSLRANLYLYDGSGNFVAAAQNPGRNETISFTICGGRQARVRVSRRSGYGSYTLQANIP
jgi:hypothetical protein